MDMEIVLYDDAMCIEFEKSLKYEERATATRRKYLRDVHTFLGYKGDRSLTKDIAIQWKEQLMERGYKTSSINSMIASVNHFLDFLGRPDCKVKSLRKQKSVYRPEEKELTRHEYLKLLEASRDDQRLNLLLQTLCSTGIRISELRYFTVEALYEGDVTVNCKGKIRTVLIPGKLRKLLKDYAKKCGIKHGPIFITKTGKCLDRSNIWASMKKLCKKAGVNPSKVFPHNLRRLFARMFYRTDKDLAKLADVLGHSSIETTRLYIMETGNEHRKKMERLDLVVGVYA